MKRVKRHTNNEKKQENDGDVKYFKSYALVFLMLVIALFIITMSPDYKYEPASRGTTDLKAISHNILFNFDIPVNYFVIVIPSLIAFVILFTIIVNMYDSEIAMPDYVLVPFLFLPALVIFIVVLITSMDFGINKAYMKADVSIDKICSHSKNMTPLLEVKDKASQKRLDEFLKESNNIHMIDDDNYLDSVFGEEKPKKGKSHLFKIVEHRDGTYSLVGTKYNSSSTKDVKDYGKLSKAQVKELSLMVASEDS